MHNKQSWKCSINIIKSSLTTSQLFLIPLILALFSSFSTFIFFSSIWVLFCVTWWCTDAWCFRLMWWRWATALYISTEFENMHVKNCNWKVHLFVGLVLPKCDASLMLSKRWNHSLSLYLCCLFYCFLFFYSFVFFYCTFRFECASVSILLATHIKLTEAKCYDVVTAF